MTNNKLAAERERLHSEKNKLIQEQLISNQSVEWWEKEMISTIVQIDKLEAAKWSPAREKKLAEVRKRMLYLLAKGETEIAMINKFDKKRKELTKREAAITNERIEKAKKAKKSK